MAMQRVNCEMWMRSVVMAKVWFRVSIPLFTLCVAHSAFYQIVRYGQGGYN